MAHAHGDKEQERHEDAVDLRIRLFRHDKLQREDSELDQLCGSNVSCQFHVALSRAQRIELALKGAG